MLSRAAAVVTFRRLARSSPEICVWPGAQIWVIRTPSKPASFARSSWAFAATSVGERTASSVAPTSMGGPPACAAGANAKASAAAATAILIALSLPMTLGYGSRVRDGTC